MCRGKAEGGRRCTHHQQGSNLVAHNERRRANRAIKARIIAWAEQEGATPAELAALRAGGPKAAKDWAAARGKNPADFAPSAPIPPRGQAPAPRPATPAAGARGPAPIAGPAPAAAAGGMSPGPAWASATWATPGLTAQISTLLSRQGGHRDERSLLSGKPGAIQRAHGGTNETSRVELDNGLVGYHKPFSGLNDSLAQMFGQDAAQQSVHEAAAWQLAKRMGPPWDQMVPPCVIREVNGELGSFAVERPGRTNVRDFRGSPEWKDAAFFDALVGQQDRHHGNYLLAGDRITLIDHGYAFAREGDYMNWSNFQTQRFTSAADRDLSSREIAVLDDLIASPDLFGLRDVLEPERAERVLGRAKLMKSLGRIAGPGVY